MRPLFGALLAASTAAADLDPADLTPYARDGVQGEFLHALGLVDDDPPAAARKLDSLRPRYALLADYVLYHAARAYYRARRFDLAAARASRVGRDSALDADARLLHADALAAAGRRANARAVWRAYLERYPDGARLAEVHYRLGDYRRALALGTLGPWEKRAREHVRLSDLRPEDRLVRGRAFARAQRHGDAETSFETALRASRLPGDVECELRFERAQAVWYQRDRARAEPLYAEAAAACARAGDEDLRVQALYQRGRCLANLGRHEEAAAVFAETQQVGRDAGHSYADDARLREAEAWVEAGQPDRARDLLSTLPDLFPDGDMRHEAIWRVARLAWFDGRLDDALAALDRSLELGRETDNGAAGRAHYWRGRVMDRRGARDEARRAYEAVLREHPLSYYALFAMQRLRAGFPETARALEEYLLDPIPEEPPPLRFADRPVFHDEGFRRALELWRLGLPADAWREWAAAGVRPGGDHEDALWVVAALRDREGDFSRSHELVRRALTRFQASWPHGEHAARWRIAYPRAFGDVIEREAAAAGVPPALALAIAREESAFNPAAVSYAHAYGLMQMIVPTAERFAPEGLRVTPERLRDPETNARIATRFLAFQIERYGGAAPLAVAAYNAGENAVDRWRRERDGLDLDELVETIPYDQTRGYTKRVLASWFAYTALYARAGEDRVPAPAPR